MKQEEPSKLTREEALSRWKEQTQFQKPSRTLQPAWHLVVLCIVTFGIYELYWFYRNWADLYRPAVTAWWRTIGLGVPILNIILIYRQFRYIRDFAEEAGCDKSFSPAIMTFAYIFLGLFTLLPEISGFSEIFGFLAYLTVWPLARVQSVINAYYTKREPKLAEGKGFSGLQIVLIIVGGIFWLVILTTYFIF